MLPIQVFVRKVDVVVDLEVIEPGYCSVISIINDAMKELLGASVTSKDKWELSNIFPWNGVQHTILTNKELMIVFKEFDLRDLSSITFDLNAIPILVEAPEELHAFLQYNKELIVLLQQNKESIQTIEDRRPSIERAQTEGENEWALGSDESDGQSDDSSLDMNDSSDEDNDPTMVARHCHENQWTPNPNGSIDLKEGQIFGNAKMVKDAVKSYVIQEGFQLKKLKNDRLRYIVRCKNETCE
ncbi:hypothetical protein LWI28_009438 [Acer negundo]|uniref:Transposase MuDR plant domain-containing protein n=1 Tax=Acer negundo TaxID=4023 RepID=A0AAD5ITF8_ACENE|nr:hypothetical protein LWI28_009438 [Acer negundo]